MDNNKNTSIEDFEIRDDVVRTLKNRFTTYGYKQVQTSAFESYDRYMAINGTVNRDEMVKVIAPSGHVQVLRPDVTIPLTRLTAASKENSANLRLFYVMDVFRNSTVQEESTQAGIELFDDDTTEADGEVIMLAAHTLADLQFHHFKIEIGHAGFFKALVEQSNISTENLLVLQSLIQSKNMAEIGPFLDELGIDDDLKTAIQSIPLLYGKPEEVIKQARGIIRNEKMEETLKNLTDVVDVLKDYGLVDSVVFNLGLINHMNYYTGIVFQGFVDYVGKPVVMGGRYNNLGKQYGKFMPAVGFAFEVDVLVHALRQHDLAAEKTPAVDIAVYYDQEKRREALHLAGELRNQDYQVITFPNHTNQSESLTFRYTINLGNEKNLFTSSSLQQNFSDSSEIFTLLQNEKENQS